MKTWARLDHEKTLTSLDNPTCSLSVKGLESKILASVNLCLECTVATYCKVDALIDCEYVAINLWYIQGQLYILQVGMLTKLCINMQVKILKMVFYWLLWLVCSSVLFTFQGLLRGYEDLPNKLLLSKLINRDDMLRLLWHVMHVM